MAESPCGVDIEVARNVDARRIAQRYFAASELALLDTLDGQARERAFFRLWTLKEAAVKALGEGLAGNLARLEFDLGGNPPALRDKRIALRFFQHVEDFFLAAAVAGNTAAQWRMREVSPAGLLHVSS